MLANHIAWAAGLFEGEGTMYMSGKKPVMEIGMTDRDVIERYKDFAECGWIRTKIRPHPWKTMYIHRTNGRHLITEILEAFLPYFGDRRAHKALDILDSLECS